MESSFRAQISTVQYPSLAYIFACLFVCLFKASPRLVQFVVLWSQKEKASDPQRSRKAKGAGMLIKNLVWRCTECVNTVTEGPSACCLHC